MLIFLRMFSPRVPLSLVPTLACPQNEPQWTWQEVDLYSASIVVPHTQGAQVRITQCYLQISLKLHRTCLYLISIHQMALPQTEAEDI